MAEELTFYRASGLLHGADIAFAATQAPQPVLDAFNSFGSANMRRFREFLRNPQGGSPYATTADISTRGAIWSFLRYAADRRGGDESALVALACQPSGGPVWNRQSQSGVRVRHFLLAQLGLGDSELHRRSYFRTSVELHPAELELSLNHSSARWDPVPIGGQGTEYRHHYHGRH